MTRFLDRLRIERDLYRLVRGHTAFTDFHVERIIKTGPAQITAVATLDGRTVVVKRSLEPEADRKVCEAKRELDIVAATMNAAPFQVNKCLAVYPELGLIVLDFVPGVRLDHAIRHADAAERAKILSLAGGWLRTYAASRSEKVDGFAPGWWIKQRITAFGVNQPDQVQALFDELLAHLRVQAPALRGSRITKGAIHGDYASINAHYHDGTIYGVDVQGFARLPVVQDVAKFLVWTQAQTPLEAPVAPMEMNYVHGVAEPDFTAFIGSGVLPIDEVETLLPFFIGLHMLKSIADFQTDPKAMAQTRRMIARFIAGSD